MSRHPQSHRQPQRFECPPRKLGLAQVDRPARRGAAFRSTQAALQLALQSGTTQSTRTRHPTLPHPKRGTLARWALSMASAQDYAMSSSLGPSRTTRYLSECPKWNLFRCHPPSYQGDAWSRKLHGIPDLSAPLGPSYIDAVVGSVFTTGRWRVYAVRLTLLFLGGRLPSSSTDASGIGAPSTGQPRKLTRCGGRPN